MNASKIEFHTDDYLFSHGREPKGYGSWAFSEVKNPLDDNLIHWFNGCLYSEAKKQMAKKVKAINPDFIGIIYVLT